MPSSRRQAANPSKGTSGYIAIRWSQHSLHGVKCAASEKYRLPLTEMAATRKPSTSACGPIASANACFHRAAVGENCPATHSTRLAATVTSATTLSSARNSVTVSVVMPTPKLPGADAYSRRREPGSGTKLPAGSRSGPPLGAAVDLVGNAAERRFLESRRGSLPVARPARRCTARESPSRASKRRPLQVFPARGVGVVPYRLLALREHRIELGAGHGDRLVGRWRERGELVA